MLQYNVSTTSHQKNYKSCKETEKYDPDTRKEKQATETIWESDHTWEKEKRLQNSHYKYIHKTKGNYGLKSKERYHKNITPNRENQKEKEIVKKPSEPRQYSQPSMSMGSTSMESINCNSKIFEKKFFRKFQKTKLKFAMCWQLFT